LKLLRLSFALALPCCVTLACSAILGLEAPPIPAGTWVARFDAKALNAPPQTHGSFY
jgi:hypothetical protein